jgi:predicted acylesterase/phospholipase RssA
VLGGGSANGAFGAGFVWSLLEVLQQCRSAHQGGCHDARVDLVVGTSTGTLIGALVDLYFTAGHEREAMQLLVDNYTCSVEADLYCAPDEHVWKLFQDARGIVRFNGIASKIDRFITREVEHNALELVGVTVDLRYGEVLGFSDQDPADAAAGCGRRDALLSSIVLPVMAEPVASIELRRGKRAGPFVDGGVSSVVPMLEAVRRGAERAVVVSNYPLAPEPVPAPRNAFDVLLRALTLAMLNPGPNEVQRAELFAHARRRLEYQVCRERFAHWDAAVPQAVEAADPEQSTPPEPPTATAPLDADAFCRREPDAIAGAGTPWTGALPSADVAGAFRSAWVFRTEGHDSERGYAFDPAAMRDLFLLGIRAFHDRCRELLEVLAIDGAAAAAACTQDDAPRRPRFRDIGQCSNREIPECRGPIACTRR